MNYFILKGKTPKIISHNNIKYFTLGCPKININLSYLELEQIGLENMLSSCLIISRVNSYLVSQESSNLCPLFWINFKKHLLSLSKIF